MTRPRTIRRLVLATLAGVLASCTIDGDVDWHGGEWRDLVWRSLQPMGDGIAGFQGHGFAPAVAFDSPDADGAPGSGPQIEGDTLYVLGGGASCAAPLSTVTWSKISRNPCPAHPVLALPSARAGGGAVALNGRLHFMGGCAAAAFSEVLAFDFLDNQWHTLAPMLTPRYGFATAALDAKIYVAAGASVDTGGNAFVLPGNFEVYDSSLDTWTGLPRLPTERLYAAGAAADGKFFVIGGQNGAGTAFFDVVEIFDPSTNEWTTGASMPTARAGGAAVLEGRIIMVGGKTLAGPSDVVEIYDPYRDEWSTALPSLTARSFVHPVASGSELYAVGGIGGIGSAGTALVSIEGLVPVDSVESNVRPQGWQDSAGGNSGGIGAGGTCGSTSEEGDGGCSIQSTGGTPPRGWLLVMAAVATAVAFRSRPSR